VEGEELEHAKKEMTKAWRELQSAYPPDQDGAKNKKSSTEIIKTVLNLSNAWFKKRWLTMKDIWQTESR
jgi:hypothetical protein